MPLYTLFFYISTFVLSEFGELIVTIFLPTTPIVVVLGLFMLTSVYVLCLGYEVLARLSELMLPVVVLFNLVIYTLIYASGQADFSQLKPVLANGINPVLQATIPGIVNFPFGEIVVFLLYWSLVDRKTSMRPISLAAIGISGVFIIVSTIMLISVLGVEYASNATFPFYDLVKIVNVMDILTNLDVVVVVVMFIGGFFKMTIYFGGGVLAVKSLFKIGNEKWIIVITGICTTWFTIVFYRSFPFQRWSGEIMDRNIQTFFQIICPALVLMILWVKSKLIPTR
ncbi:GerAB/ArcD/ProY family transporter [Paenibacillus sp. A14]|uniref:GerAB/ArcD/ProY family transporter n=1 Tax=Paenibacillus sp. A14 TaxID=3119820 RepID=UPI002FE1905B